MKSILTIVLLLVLAVTAQAAVDRVRGTSTGGCPDGGRMYPCFMWPCWRRQCESPQGLTCVADYCSPGCGRKWKDASGNFVTCDREGRTQRRRN